MHAILRTYQACVFLVARILGLLPVTVDASRTPHTARRSRLLMAYSLVLVLGGTAACVLKTTSVLQRHEESGGDAFRELLLTFVTTFQIVVPLLKADEYAAVINQYGELISKSDDRFGSGLPDPFTTTVKVLCCSSVFLYIVPMLLIVLWIHIENRYQDWVPMAIYFTSKFSTHIQDTQLMIMVANIRARVQGLNGVLVELAGKREAPFWTNNSWRARMLDSIRESRRQHLLNAQLAHAIETAYGPQLLVSLAIFFVDAFFTLYFLVLDCVYGLQFPKNDMFYTVVMTFWTVITFVQIVTVVRVCDGAVTESAATSHLIRQLSWKIEDPQFLFELEAFWLQTQHLPVRYRAGQYFHMNNKLIYKMARLMASYLLWATQMRVQHVPSSAAP